MKSAVWKMGTVALLLAVVAAACGVGSESDDTAGEPSPSGAGGSSGGQVEDIEAVIEASRDEGPLVIYGNPSGEQWEPVLAAFSERYPWIDVETFDLGGAEAFQRYLSEEATGSETADMIVNTDGAGWLDLVDRGQVVDYLDPELEALREEARLAPGVFAWSFDPLVALFNKEALPEDEQPTSLAELADAAEDLDGRIGTVAVENANAGLGTYGFVDAGGEDAWAVLEAIGPHARAEEGTGALLGKIQSGEYAVGFFVSGAVRALVDLTDAGEILSYRYFTDATALPARGMGVTTGGDSPNSAKVLINFLLSEEGQAVSCEGGFTPHRDGVDCPQSLTSVEEVVGEGNLILVGYPPELPAEQAAMQERWNTAFGR